MKFSTLIILATFSTAAVLAMPRLSPDYSIAVESVDFGGQASASADYTMLGSFSAMPGNANSASYAAGSGYLSQLPQGATLPPAFVAWQAGMFANADPADAEPLADADHDGVDNLAEFAFGLDPAAPAAQVLTATTPGLPLIQTEPVVSMGNTDVTTISFLRRTDGSVDYQVETSSTLETWSPAAVAQLGPPQPAAAGYELVKFAEISTTTNAPRRFMRVCLTLKSP